MLGVTGALRRDEVNSVRSSDLYLQGEIELAPAWLATLGAAQRARCGSETQDHYLSNGDDSGTLSYGYNNPVLALQWLPSPGLNLYVSAGQGFESPTLNELAYRPDGGTGFNTALQPQTSLQLELGAKWRDDGAGPGHRGRAVPRRHRRRDRRAHQRRRPLDLPERRQHAAQRRRARPALAAACPTGARCWP